METFLLYEDCPSSLWRAVWNRVVIFASYYIYGSCVFKVPCYKKIEYIINTLLFSGYHEILSEGIVLSIFYTFLCITFLYIFRITFY